MSADDYLYGFKGKTWFEMTWPELEAEIKAGTEIVIVPVGTIEPHGRHLALGNDTLLGREYARRTALHLEKMGARSIVGPVIPFGFNPAAMSFPGAISVQAETLLALIVDVCKSLAHHGFKKQVLMMAHGGNWSILQVAAQKVSELAGAQVLALNWIPALYERDAEILISKRNEGHAGEGETSRLLATHPELVSLNKAVAYYVEEHGTPENRAKAERIAKNPIPHSTDVLRGGGVFRSATDFKKRSENAMFGDPTLATVAKGNAELDVIGEWAAKVIHREFC